VTSSAQRAVEVIREYWARMGTNDFRHVAEMLAEDFVLDWPQSKERIRGRERFARVNEEYPAHGRWEFTVHRIVGDDEVAVSDVSVTDGVIQARAITFSTVQDGLIIHQIEYWPDDYPAPENRKHLVEPMV